MRSSSDFPIHFMHWSQIPWVSSSSKGGENPRSWPHQAQIRFISGHSTGPSSRGLQKPFAFKPFFQIDRRLPSDVPLPLLRRSHKSGVNVRHQPKVPLDLPSARPH